jgi:pilus assembly protein Flp/PilA
MFRSSSVKKEKGQGLVEYSLILVLVAVVVIAVLMLLGPIIGNVFTTVNSTLTLSSGGGATSVPSLGCADIHPDGYATGPGYGWDCYSPTFGPYNMP